jgi:predicted nucleic acid-binding protein
MRILLDTNIVLRLVEPGHGHHQVTVEALDILRRRGHEPVIVPQILYEFWSVATRPVENNGLGLTPAEAHAELKSAQRLFPLLRDERAVFAIWEHLVVSLGVKGKQAHDARIAAAMQRHAVTHLLTFNTVDFVRYPAVIAVSPLDIVAGVAIA